VIIYDTVCLKYSLYEFGSVQMLHYFGFTIQLALLRVFDINVKNLTNYHKCMVFYEELSLFPAAV